jgi:hypothetical protein
LVFCKRGAIHRALLILIAICLVGCAAPRKRAAVAPAETLRRIGLDEPEFIESVNARCPMPQGWQAEPLKQSHQHNHQVWLAPSGNTAYGVIKFGLPFPVSAEMVLPFFLKQMRETEGEAVLIEKNRDEEIDGMRFIADGGLYRVRSILITRGWQGWVIYAGTVRKNPEDAFELKLAEEARENTRVGVE